MGGEALQQLAAQGRVAPSEGVVGIGAGGCLRESLQQLLPERVGSSGLAGGFGRQRGLLEGDRRQGCRAPALSPQQSQPLLGIEAGSARQQQGRLAAPLGSTLQWRLCRSSAVELAAVSSGARVTSRWRPAARPTPRPGR